MRHHPGTERAIRAGAALAGAAGAVALVAADLSTLHGVRVFGSDIAHVSAGAHHGYALFALGVLVLLLLWWAAISRRRLAMAALVLTGVAACAIAAAVDVPVLASTAPVNQFYVSTSAWTGSAIYLEFAAAALLIISGAIQLKLARAAPPSRQRALSSPSSSRSVADEMLDVSPST